MVQKFIIIVPNILICIKFYIDKSLKNKFPQCYYGSSIRNITVNNLTGIYPYYIKLYLGKNLEIITLENVLVKLESYTLEKFYMHKFYIQVQEFI